MACCFEQILEAPLYKKKKIYAHLLTILKNIRVRWAKLVGHCWRSKDKLKSNVFHRSRWYSDNHFVDIIFGRMQLSQHPLIHSTYGHSDILAITLLILSPARCSCLNIHRYTAPVGMMTFWWSLQSYQYIYQQHLLYSHLQVTLIYYIEDLPSGMANKDWWWENQGNQCC